MAVTGWIRNAVASAANWIDSGRTLTVTTREFWNQWSSPPVAQRTDILDRANAVLIGREEFASASPQSSAGEIFGGTGYATSGPAVGPLETEDATIHGRAIFGTSGGGVAYRSFRLVATWDATIAEIRAELANVLASMSDGYGMEDGEEIPEETWVV